MTQTASYLYAAFCGATILFQVALIMGAPWGRYTQGGTNEGALPVSGRIIAVVSIFLLIFMSVAILSVADAIQVDWPRWTGWAALSVSALSCILNWITPSRVERIVWGPVTTVMLLFAVVVMVS